MANLITVARIILLFITIAIIYIQTPLGPLLGLATTCQLLPFQRAVKV